MDIDHIDPWLKNSKVYAQSHEIKINSRNNYIADPSDPNKEIYSLIKSGSKSRKDTPDSMTYKGSYVKGQDKLEAIATQLKSCFLNNVPSFGTSNAEIDESLLEIYHSNFSPSNHQIWENFNLNASLEDIKRMIMDLKINKDPGPMNISSSFLQHNIDITAPIIHNAINTIFLTGRIPDDWKKCYKSPIPKKGSAIEVENYRGIAMQSCIPKILDKFITKLLYDFLGDSITKNQHGFRKGKSTTSNLIEMTQLIHDNSKTAQIDVIYFDYSKAFDQIRHDLLAVKLCKLSMPYNFFRLIMKFIINRKYILKVDNIVTNLEIVDHCGPVIYIIFSNDLDLDALCYADDMKLFKIIRNMEDRKEHSAI